MDVVRLSLPTAMCHTGLCNCNGSVTLYSRLECGGLRACGEGQLHQPFPTPITRLVPNHTESQCTVIYRCIQPAGRSVHSILPSLSQKRTVPTVAVGLILLCSLTLCCLLKIVSPYRILFFFFYGCNCLVCRNLELVFEITSLGHVAGVLGQRDRPIAELRKTDTHVHTAVRREGHEPTIPLCEPQYTF
jgi:hypothetical protein